ncbi:unnamed protein product [Mytilus edulis]|uniref:Uncharacterized protein n=1 Tax=Mytilus edulis TaxID=6550 RepID=A0A8S3QLN4_MYTED|nr:unnamed protein product [Mytilus edulis]
MLLVLIIQTTAVLTVTAQKNLTLNGTASQSSFYSSNNNDGKPENAIYPPISNEFSLTTCSSTKRDKTGEITSDIDSVLEKWKIDYEKLYNSADINGSYDDEFLKDIKNKLQNRNNLVNDNNIDTTELNRAIERDEVREAVFELSQGSASNASNIAIQGDMGLTSTKSAEILETFRLFLRVSKAYDTRLTYKVHMWINLVPQGVAVQRTTYLDRNANLAIEGPANNEWADGCSATAAGQVYAWWGLQLPAVAHMTNILIYYRKDTPFRMDGFRLYLENGTADQSSASGLCYTDQGIPGYPTITQNLTCNMLAENMYFVNRRNNGECYVELCYVAIYGCWKGTWGRNCSELCPPNCINQNCYPKTGLCVWGCDAHNCLNNQCDNKTGSCTDGCAIGQAGKYCNKQCENGFYGFNCKEQCATCFNMSCERLEGNCSYGCIDERYEGVRCQTLGILI